MARHLVRLALLLLAAQSVAIAVPISIYAKGTSADKKLSQHGAVAGSAFLQNFVVTFDYKKSVVVLERF